MRENVAQLYMCHHGYTHHPPLFLFSCPETTASAKKCYKRILLLQYNNLLEKAFQHGHLHPAISQGQVKSHESRLSLLSISEGLQRGPERDSLF